MNRLSIIFLLLSLLAVVGCTTNYLGISATSGDVNVEVAAKIATFQVQADELPAFLGPILVSNLSVALAERGLQPVMEGADAIVTLRYIQRDLNVEPEHAAFDERIDPGGEARFVAEIVAEMKSQVTGEIYWTGSLQRIHSIRPGDYMHTGRASIALLDAFRDLLSNYPD